MVYKVLLVFFVLLNKDSICQRANKIKLCLDIGTDFSVGKNKYVEQFGIINPTVIASYFTKKRFNNQGYRIHASALISAKDFYFGLQSGVIVHFNEEHPIRTYNQVSVPVQFRVLNTIIEKSQHCFLVDGAAGINIFSFKDFFYRIKTGPIVSAGLYYRYKNRYSMRIGYEHQINNGTYIIYENSIMNTTEEYIKFKQKRSVIISTLGLTL